MKPVYIVADNIISPIGFHTKEVFAALCNNSSGVKKHNDTTKSNTPFFASLFTPDFWNEARLDGFTPFEQLLILSIKDAISKVNLDVSSPKTALVLSSTKGNISLLENNELTDDLKQQISLSSSAKKIAGQFNISTQPVIVSHACISGLVALITGMRLIQNGVYDHVIVSGADIITRFILSGFLSFQAISDEPCRPFDAARKGINLGEAAATIILSTQKPGRGESIQLAGGSVSNDANHISGPSRTGEELFMAIQAAINEAGVAVTDIDFISAHGTATLYNDDMESKAITLAELQGVPVNSLKGYFGHTLGAAGLLESVVSIQSLRENTIIPTKGFETPGTTQPINVCHTLQQADLQTCLKTASGFGGCNAAVVWSKQ